MTETNNAVAFIGFKPGAAPTAEQIEAKARELLAQLTLDEKLGMMDGDIAFWPGMAEMMGGGYGDHPWPAGVVSRLGIPGIRFADGPRGVVMDGATTFPVSMARGAAWDVDLEERIGDVIGRELRSMGGTLFGGVCINLLRHPAWGRAQETCGEDPYHMGEMGAALTRGVHSSRLGTYRADVNRQSGRVNTTNPRSCSCGESPASGALTVGLTSPMRTESSSYSSTASNHASAPKASSPTYTTFCSAVRKSSSSVSQPGMRAHPVLLTARAFMPALYATNE